jgi:hypothetical protein
VPESLAEAVLNQDPIAEAPHNFYCYPARFSPAFAREAIKAFTKPGQSILDPFCGSGTVLVEAMRLRRKAVGLDISSLATFIAQTQTQPLSVHDRAQILNLATLLQNLDEPQIILDPEEDENTRYYARNLPDEAKIFFRTLSSWVQILPKEKQQRFARFALLGTGQWALDCKKQVPDWEDLRDDFCRRLTENTTKHFEFYTTVARSNQIPRSQLSTLRKVINRPTETLSANHKIPKEWLPAKLVLTSPPYPGVHVLYHRWQINGRRETPAPFWLINGTDGAGESHYVLGQCKQKTLKTYFDRLEKAFYSIRPLIAGDAVIVQLVGFSDPSWQLPAYLEALGKAGFSELRAKCTPKHLHQGRIWRNVPGRKWYASLKTPSSEVLLFHKLK